MKHRLALRLAGVLVLACCALAQEADSNEGRGEGLVIGSKNFSENRLLAELFAGVLRAELGVPVETQLLAGTKLCFDALRAGEIDMYPEYTGTGLVDLLERDPLGDAAETLSVVRREFRGRWDLHWLSPLGFENAYELAVPRELAERLELATISDLARVAGTLKAGLGYEFLERPDGLPGLEAAYGLRFRATMALQQTAKYAAAGARQIDCLDVYTTDGLLIEKDLVVLEDDRAFFPPYAAAPLVSGAALEREPRLALALGRLGGLLDADRMRALNHEVEVLGVPLTQAAHAFLTEHGLAGDTTVDEVGTRGKSLVGYLWADRSRVLQRTLEHLGFSALALFLGALVALPVGLWLEGRRALAEPAIRLLAITQTIPSIALLAFMIPLFGTGAVPAVWALWLYSLFPMVRATYSGVRDAHPAAVSAATALGMTHRQVLLKVRLPLAVPPILAGVRTAAVITIGTATLAAFIGAGGLGLFIVSGLQRSDTIQILAGAVPAALLAVGVDALLGGLERYLRPRGV